MDLSDLKNKVKDSNDVTLYLAKWRTRDCAVVSPSIGKDLKDQIKNIVIKSLDDNCKKTTNTYNVIGANDETVEVTKKKEYSKEIGLVLDGIKKPTTNFKFQQSKFSFFVFEIKYGINSEKSLFAFRRVKHMNFLKKGFIGLIEEGYFKKLDNKDRIGVDDKIDFFLNEEDICILEHISFERILKLSNDFADLAKKALDNDKMRTKITGFEKLRENALDNGNVIKRLAKISSSKNRVLFLDNIADTKMAIDKFNLGIDIEDNKLVYGDISQLTSFVSLMQDAYYETLIGHQNGEDDRR